MEVFKSGSNQLTIKDSDGNILASNTNIRTDVTGIEGANFTDVLIYNGVGSYTGNIDISGTDARLRATTTSDNWNIKAFIRAI